jgi:hypothetical protein
MRFEYSSSSSSSSSSPPSSSSSIGTTARCGLWPAEQDPSLFSCHQLSPPSLNLSSLFLCSTFVTIRF